MNSHGKFLIVLFFTVFTGLECKSQDQIILHTAEEIKAKVSEIKLDVIVYKDFDNLDGPSIEIKKESVFMIIYENGKAYKPDFASVNEQPVKKPFVVDSTGVLHILTLVTDIPQIRLRDGSPLNGVDIGLSYEFQGKKRIFGLKVAPMLSNTVLGSESWALSLSLSPRWYLVNKSGFQFGVGLEGAGGTIFKSSVTPEDYTSFLLNGHLVLASHLFTVGGFNGNIELGFGYEYWQERYAFDRVVFNSQGTPVYEPLVDEFNLFSCFLRISIGGRFKSK